MTFLIKGHMNIHMSQCITYRKNTLFFKEIKVSFQYLLIIYYQKGCAGIKLLHNTVSQNTYLLKLFISKFNVSQDEF